MTWKSRKAFSALSKHNEINKQSGAEQRRFFHCIQKSQSRADRLHGVFKIRLYNENGYVTF